MVGRRIMRLQAGFDQVQMARKVHATAALLQARLEKVKEDREKIVEAVVAFVALGDRVRPEDAAEVVLLGESNLAIREQLELLIADPTLLAADKGTYQELGPQIHALADRLHERAHGIWLQYVSNTKPGDHRDILKAFSKSDPAIVKRLAELRAAIESDWTQGLPTEEDVIAFDSAVEDYNARLEDLFGSDIRQDILDILRRTAKDGVALGEFTVDVLDWLEEKGVKDSFRVRLQ